MVHGKRLHPLLVLLIIIIGALILLTPRPALSLDHGGVIGVSEIWYAADNPHVVIANVTVSSGATLTLEPGVEVRFDANRTLTIQGTLNATGTLAQGILFTRNTASNWSSITFSSMGTGSMSYCTIENATYGIYKTSGTHLGLDHSVVQDCNYGMYLSTGTVDLSSVTASGNSSYGLLAIGFQPTLLDGNCVFDGNATGFSIRDVAATTLTTPMAIRNSSTAGLNLDGCDNVTIDSLILESNDATNGAIHLQDCGEVTLGAGNTIGGAGVENSWAVTLGAGSYLSAGSVVPTSGNVNNDIRAAGGASARTGTWRTFAGLDYVVTANFTVSAGGELVIEPGVTVRLDANRTMSFAGQLTAQGAAGNEVRFVPNSATNWSSLSFNSSGGGTLEHCLIENATYGIYANSSGAIDLDHVVSTGCTYGMYGTIAATVTVTDCRYEANSRGIHLDGPDLSLGSTHFVGNTHTGLYMGEVAPTWLDDDIVFDGNGTGCHLEDVPGLEFTEPFAFMDNTEVALRLEGCDNPSVDNQLFTGNVGTHGAMYVVDCGEFVLGGGNAIGGAGLENSWPLAVGAGAYPSVGSVIPTSGNTNNDIRVSGGASARSGTWRLFPGLDYVVMTNVTIQAGGEHILAPGVTLRVNSNRQFGISGTFTAVGAPGQEILITRHGATAWSSLSFSNAGSATLEHCVIDGATYGLYANSTGSFALADDVFSQCTYGIYATNTAAFVVDGCEFNDNTYGAHMAGGSLEIGSTSFTGNSNIGLRCDSVDPTFLDAGVVFQGNATGLEISDITGPTLHTPITFTGQTVAGLHVEDCDGPSVDNLVFTGNAGTHGALYLVDCGEFELGAGNTLGGAGQENSWPLAIGAGAYPSVTSIIPTAGNTDNDIRAGGGTSDRTGRWRHFPGLDYVVLTNTTIEAGGQLTIDAGNTVRIDPNRQISVRGTLDIAGSPGDEVLLTRNGATAWSSLNFGNAGGGRLEHCTIEGATYGLYANASGTIELEAVTVEDNSYGIYATGAGTIGLVNSCIVNNNTYGIYRTNTELVFGANLSQWNDIYGNGTGQDGRDLRNGDTDVHASFVHWGTMNWVTIEEHIHDLLDDENLGRVTYLPYVSADHVSVVVGVDDDGPDPGVPAVFALAQNHPNPFNPRTSIGFDLPSAMRVRLRVHDLRGALVATLVDAQMPAGRHSVPWLGLDRRGRTVASGVYIYRIEAGDQRSERTMMLVR